jgi:hypothetical protein
MCAVYPYNKHGNIIYLEGLCEQLTTPTLNWLPLTTRVTIFNANHKYDQVLSLLNDESLNHASKPDRRILKYQLMIALVMTDETARAQEIAREILAEPVQDRFCRDANYVLQITPRNPARLQELDGASK